MLLPNSFAWSICMLIQLGASLLGNMLAGKGVIRAGKETIRAAQKF